MDTNMQNTNTNEVTGKGVTVLNASEMPQETISVEKGQSYLLQGNSYDWLKKIPENSVDSTVCDPPYLLNFMGKHFDREKGNPADDVEFWKLVLKTMKPGAYLLAAGIGRTHHRLMTAIENAGFEIRDCVYHCFGSGFPKSANIEKQLIKKGYIAEAETFKGYGTALKPAIEIWTLARKPFKGTVAENVLKHGTGGINIDGCRVEGVPQDRSKSTPRKNTDKYGTANPKLNPPHEQGRFPANLIHDGSDEVVGLFPNESARFFYCAKASKKDRNDGLEEFEEKRSGTERMNNSDGRKEELGESDRSILTKNSHPTVKPTKLMQYLVRLVTPKGGTVLDPFMGSGSTGKACKLEGFDFIGIELDEEYCKIAEARIASV